MGVAEKTQFLTRENFPGLWISWNVPQTIQPIAMASPPPATLAASRARAWVNSPIS